MKIEVYGKEFDSEELRGINSLIDEEVERIVVEYELFFNEDTRINDELVENNIDQFLPLSEYLKDQSDLIQAKAVGLMNTFAPHFFTLRPLKNNFEFIDDHQVTFTIFGQDEELKIPTLKALLKKVIFLSTSVAGNFNEMGLEPYLAGEWEKYAIDILGYSEHYNAHDSDSEDVDEIVDWLINIEGVDFTNSKIADMLSVDLDVESIDVTYKGVSYTFYAFEE